jgi:hypothetical protein
MSPPAQLRINAIRGRFNSLELYIFYLPAYIDRRPVVEMLGRAEEAVMQAQEWIEAHIIREWKEEI